MRTADPRPIVVTVLNEGERLAVGLTDLRSAGQIARVDSAPALLAEVRRRAADAPAHELGAAVLALLPEPVREFLAASPARFLVLQLDEELTDIPWEMAYDGASFLGEKFALARQVVSGPAGAAAAPPRPARDALKVLVADAEAAPQGPAAAESVAQRLAAIDGLAVTTVHVGDITRARALKLIAEHDVVHYAGPVSRAAAGDVAWWRGREPLSLRGVAALATPPQLLVAENADRALAHAACRAGLNVLTGAYHAQFVPLFYAALARGAPLGEAVREARPAARRAGPALYGDAAQVLRAGTDRAPHEDNRRQVTILSCDIVDSTSLLKTLGDEKYSDLLGTYRALCETVVSAHDGYIEEARGDGVLCLFGFPIAREDSAARCVQAACEILRTVRELGVRVRLGVATGQVAVAGGRAVGDVVHLGTRLQANAEPDTILASEATRRIVRERFAFQPVRRKLDLKGFDEPGPVYRVLSETVAADADPFEAARRLTPFVGRAAELGLLEQHWSAARAGAPRTVLLSGEAGIGKSRLIHEFRRLLALRGEQLIDCRCAPDHAHSAFRPVIDFLLRHLGIHAADSAEEKRGKIGRLMSSRGEFDAGAALIADLLSVPSGGRDAPRPSAAKQRQMTLDLLVGWIKREAGRGPLCLIVEDVHWIDPSTRELVHRLIQQAGGLPLLVLLSQRAEAGQPWRAEPALHGIELKGVSLESARAMVIGVSGETRLPGEIVRLLAARADGVPLFIEESTRMALDAKAGAEGEAASALRLTVPATIQDLLMARLDRLAAAKPVAQIGGTIGREFSLALVESVLAHESSPLRIDNLGARLGALVESGLLVEKSAPPHATYAFKHALVRDAAYQSLWERDRKRLHRAIATVIGEQFAELGESQPELLAYHYTEAGLDAEALAHWERAARRAVSQSAHDEAISHLGKGLEVLARLQPSAERDRTELRLQLLLAGRLIATEGYGADRVERVYKRAAELCRELNDEASLLKTQLGLEGYHFMRADFEKAHAFARQAGAMLARSPDPSRRLQSQWAVGNILFHQGEGAQALELWDACLAEYDKMQHRPSAVQDPGVMCLCYSAWLKWQLGYPDQAEQRARKVVALATELNHPFSMGEAYGFCTAVHHFRGESETALEHARRAIEICEEGGFVVWLAHARLMHGRLIAELGEHAAGIGEMRQAYDLWAATGAVVTRPFYLALQAEGLALAGRPDEALEVVEHAFDIVRKYGERYHEAEIRRLVGELILQSAAVHGRDRNAEAERWFQGALDFARSRKFRGMELRAAISLARLWAAQSRDHDAVQLLAPLYRWFSEGKGTGDLVRAQKLLEELRRIRA